MANNTPFKDMHGNTVTIGTKIKIVSHYNYQHLEGQEATVIWDAQHGMYKYTFTEERRGTNFTSTDNFYGIAKFEVINKKNKKIT